jgi:hypothetical protein
MSTKTEIIYTYKSPIDIPQENIHGLQNGPTGKLSIGILDTQDYDYTYISGISGSYNSQFLPLGDGETFATIISNIAGGTGDMLLQDEPSKLSIDNVRLNTNVKRFENLQIQNANLEYMYEYTPPLIITGATLKCRTQSQLLFTNAQLNLKFKKKIKNLPVFIGAEFKFYGTRDYGYWDWSVWHKTYRGWTANILVIHDPNGANIRAFSPALNNRPFSPYQTFTGVRKYGGELGDHQSSIIRVKEPFGNPFTETYGYDENINPWIMRTQNITNLKFLINNSFIGDSSGNNWYGCYTGGPRDVGISSGDRKLFDPSALYSTYFQNDTNPGGLPQPDGLGCHGQWLMHNSDNGNVSQSSYMTNMFYVRYEDYVSGNYANVARLTHKNSGTSKYTTGTNFNEVLNIPNEVIPLNIGTSCPIATNSDLPAKFMLLQQSANYNRFVTQFGYVISDRNTVIRRIKGGMIDFSLFSQLNSNVVKTIDTDIDATFNINNTLTAYKNSNSQELNITNIQFITPESGSVLGIFGNVQSDGGSRTLAIIDSNSVSTSGESFSTLYQRTKSRFPSGATIDFANDSNYTINYKFNNKPQKTLSQAYTTNQLIVNSVQNDNETISGDSYINIQNYIRQCISNSGSTGQILTLQNWQAIGTNLRLNNNINRSLTTELNGKQIVGSTASYNIGVSGYYDFSGNPSGFNGREYIGFNTLAYGGSTSIYSIESNKVIGGDRYTIDISQYLNTQTDPYTQEININSFNVPTDESYKINGIPELGIPGLSFAAGSNVLWDTAIVLVQYNYDIGLFGQYVEQSLLTDDSNTQTIPIVVTNNFPTYLEKSFIIPKDITLPLDPSNIVFVPYSAIPGTPNIPALDLGSTAIGRDFIDVSNSQLQIDYSYGDSLYSNRFKENLNLGYTLGIFNPSSEKVIPTYLFNKQQRLVIFPNERFLGSSDLYLVNIRTNQTGYTFNQTLFNWSVYDPLLFKNYQIINHEFNGVKKQIPIDKLISLNDYTIDRTPGTNVFESITDLESDPPIDVNSRAELDNLAQILDDGIDITSIILDQVNSPSVPYLHSFFKFNYLNTDEELFLLVSSALTGSTAITAGTSGLYVELNKTNPSPFITSEDDSSYNLTNQLIKFDLVYGLAGGDQFKYNNEYLNPSLYGTGATSYLIDIKYSDLVYPNQHSLENFGFTTGSTASILIKGLLPNKTYRTNSLTFYPSSIDEYLTLNPDLTLSAAGLSWFAGTESQDRPTDPFIWTPYFYNVNEYVLNDIERTNTVSGETLNTPDNNYYVCLQNTSNSPYLDGMYSPYWKKLVDLSSKSRMYNFEFTTGVTGIEFSCKSELTQKPNNVLNYNLRLSDVKYINYPESTIHKLDRFDLNSPYKLCIDFNDPTVTLSGFYDYRNPTIIPGVFGLPPTIIPGEVLPISSQGKFIIEIMYADPFAPIPLPFQIPNDLSYLDINISGLQRDKSYLPKIYLVKREDNSFISNRIYTNPIKIPKRLNLLLQGATLTSPYSYNNNVLYTDVYRSDSQKEISSMNSYNGYLYVMDSTGKIYSKQLIESNSNIYGTYNPITRTFPFEIRNLDPATTFSDLTLRYDNTNIWLPPPLLEGTTSTSTGLIGSTYANNTILENIPEFTTPDGPVSGLVLEGIPNIQIPQFYNSKLDITEFNFYNNGPSNSYPQIYGGTAIVRRDDNTIVGYTPLSMLSAYPSTIGITLNQQKLILGQINILSISYQWTDFNNNTYDSLDVGKILYYSVVIPSDQTSLKNYSFTPLFSKIIPTVNMNTNKVGDMFLKDLKCDLILLATSNLPMWYRGNFNSNTSYVKYDVVQFSSNLYWLRDFSGSKSYPPTEDRGWVKLTDYFPTGYTFQDQLYSNNQAFNIVTYTGTSGYDTLVYRNSNYGNNLLFVQRYLKLTYNNGTFDGIFENLLPSQTYNLEYIRSQITLDNGNNIILDSGSTSMGQSQTLINYVGSESLTGSTSTFYTLQDFHYQGSTSYFTDGKIFIEGGSTGYEIVSAGITFVQASIGGDRFNDYITFQPEISIQNQTFDQSSRSFIFYAGIGGTPSITQIRFNKIYLNITGFNISNNQFNTDDFVVIKGSTGYYKEFKIRDYNSSDANNVSNLILDNLEEDTTYSDFKIYYRFAYMNRLSDTFVNIPIFTTKHGLDVLCTVQPGIKNMYAVITDVEIDDVPRVALFGTNNPNNLFIFYLYKYRANGIYGPKDETDYSMVTTNKNIPFNVKLTGADQKTVYDRMYFYHREVIDGVTVTFERVINI